MIRTLGSFLLVALLILTAWAQFDEPANPDTVRSDTVGAWSDTSIVSSDTLVPPPQAPWHRGWLYPLGIAAATCLGFVLLYTVRSR